VMGVCLCVMHGAIFVWQRSQLSGQACVALRLAQLAFGIK
jgi:hypothetical protein